MKRKLWIIEEKQGKRPWCPILEIHQTRFEGRWTLKELKGDYPDDKFRLVAYVPEKE